MKIEKERRDQERKELERKELERHFLNYSFLFLQEQERIVQERHITWNTVNLGRLIMNENILMHAHKMTVFFAW